MPDGDDPCSCGVASTAAAYARGLGRDLSEADVEAGTWLHLERGRSIPGHELLRSIEEAHSYGRDLSRWWTRYDVLLTATTPEPALALGDLCPAGYLEPRPMGAFTLPFNISGQPAISVPAGLARDGLPLGVQLVGAYGREDLLLALASQLEAAQPWAQRRPPVHASNSVAEPGIDQAKVAASTKQ